MTISSICILGAGFIGRHLIRALLLHEHVLALSVLDRNPCPDEFQDSSKLRWIQSSFSSEKDLSLALKGSDLVYHFISSTVPCDSSVDPSTEISDNVFSTLKLLELCSKYSVQRMVFASSSSVYGNQENLPISESSSTWPISYHGIHKLMIEKYLWLSHSQGKIDLRIARIANPYGPGQSLDGRQGFVAIALGALFSASTLPLRNNGDNIRDFVYIDDCIACLCSLGLQDNAPPIVNIGSGNSSSLREVVDFLQQISGLTLALSHLPPLVNDIPQSVLDIHLAMHTLSYRPQYDLKTGLLKTFNYHRNS